MAEGPFTAMSGRQQILVTKHACLHAYRIHVYEHSMARLLA